MTFQMSPKAERNLFLGVIGGGILFFSGLIGVKLHDMNKQSEQDSYQLGAFEIIEAKGSDLRMDLSRRAVFSEGQPGCPAYHPVGGYVSVFNMKSNIKNTVDRLVCMGAGGGELMPEAPRAAAHSVSVGR